MVEPVSPALVHAVAEAFYNESRLVSKFLDERVRTRLSGQSVQELPQATTHALFLRAVIWLKTLGRLNEPEDFQSVVACSRGLFELAIDLTLMVYRPKDRTAARMAAWEESAELQHAEKITKYYRSRSLPVPDLYDAQTDYIKKMSAKVNADRLAYGWLQKGKPGHPQRWTNQTTIQDAQDADKVHPSGFEEFYCTRFAQLCWGTHGSSLALMRHVPRNMVPGLGANAMRECNQFAIACAELALRHASLWDALTDSEFKAFRDERVKLTAGVLRHRTGAADSGVEPRD